MPVPRSFLAALGLSAGFLAFVAWDQSHWWRIKEDYRFGWLAPLFTAFVIRDRWPRICAALVACHAAGSPRVAGWRSVLLGTLLIGSLVSGVSLFLLGAFYRAGAGTSQPGTFAITLGTVGILLPLLLLQAPEPSGPTRRSAFFDDARVRVVTLFVFPVVIWLVSAPLVSAVETQVALGLLRRVVAIVAFIFDFFGVPIERQGNVLALPNGNVGVEEACSGLRSLTGCVFTGAFLAAVFLEGGWQKLVFLAAALVLAFGANLARSLFLTAWAYHYGADAIGGVVHAMAGYAVLGLTVLGLLCLLPIFKRRGPSIFSTDFWPDGLRDQLRLSSERDEATSR